MSSRLGAVRPGSVFSIRDFSFGDDDMSDMDAILHNIAGSSHNTIDPRMSLMVDFDDDIALAIAIQDSVESAYLDDLKRSQAEAWDHAISSHVLSQSALEYHSHDGPVASSSMPLPAARVRRPLSSRDISAEASSSTSHLPYDTRLSEKSPHNALQNNVYTHDALPDNPSLISRPSTPSTLTARSSTSGNILDDIARASRRSSVAVAAQSLQRALSNSHRGLSRANSTRSTREPSVPQPSSIDTHAELLKYRDVFAPCDVMFSCLSCGHLVSTEHCRQQFRGSTSSMLSIHSFVHLTCPNVTCHQVCCRGCLKSQTCSPGRILSLDSSPHPCLIHSCCPRAAAIGIFEALVRFEEIYPDIIIPAGSARSSFSSQSGRSRASVTSSTRIQNSERCAVQMLQVVRDLINSSNIHPIVPSLIRLSLVPKLIITLLQQKDLRFWIDHSHILLAALSLLRAFMDCSNEEMRAIVMRPLPDVAGEGLRSWATEHLGLDAVDPRAQEVGSCKKDACVPTSPAEPALSAKPIYTLIRELDSHRLQLIKLAERMSFPPTVEKIWALGDGLVYLVLQGLML